ncbi:MAG: hypothetical protein ACQEWU_16055 [Bacillota bacterium]|uniref:Membrane protein YizD n=1 Tax=Virgibacillus salarius TaxID=447199 RepID=A0A941E1H6_9BACI|nr:MULTISPECIES: hypothetical protein [Bacillaceae]NAZ10722.1 hypothetical protein [Agaribacter marinus]QRZ16543.1 hypothetical protein JUJ52_12055 [Virgibacillus sp. AGTR]MBR7798013.1 hypothetical protein [Virgibacillus salarius]MDY7046425.1 hypothetical protein [Virgibacillus sp. M23]WBX79964.1 hypothetical protein PD280_20495 [Virgibacillus salarius]
MKQFIQPLLFLLLTAVAFFLNILGLMQVIPLYITLPILFLAIYLTIYSFANRRVYRGMR